jgi:hypothetical protein
MPLVWSAVRRGNPDNFAFRAKVLRFKRSYRGLIAGFADVFDIEQTLGPAQRVNPRNQGGRHRRLVTKRNQKCVDRHSALCCLRPAAFRGRAPFVAMR